MRILKIMLSFLIVVFLVFPQTLLAQEEWTPLFDGETLNGWTQKGGDAPYTVEDGAIVGETIPNNDNSFLTTDKTYGDFILEFEVWVNPHINSGVQIRSLSKESYRDGRVHGYQVELDPSDRAWTGGIYDEARRGWLYPITQSEKSQSAFRNGQWNKVRVEAIGSTINTWVNGVQCARLVDDMTAEGFIALQVHFPWQDQMVGGKVKWRDIRILTENLEAHRTTPDPQVPEISYLKNELTELEKRRGWRLLWDGKTSDGWRGAKLDHFPESGWEIEDGVLTVQETDGGEATGPGDIVTRNQFSDFELELEFKITEGANSGIKYFVDPGLNQGPGSAIGTEFQILDDENHPDANQGVAGNRQVGSLYDLIAAENLSAPSRSKPFNGVGRWNKARIVSKDGHVEHWLNNQKVVEYDRFSQMFAALVAYSKYEKWEGFGRWPQGHLLLQDHGNEVSFRSIKVREL
ncbi:DUF1080 domain-containing protein [Halalkalibaculum sp. DA384]|uniref:3-keto-disaccharide hydrolase n=1 Tax=Halalkalibaculum sp. DA384 TaxID=3373606 RepID=UPI0037544BE4